MLKQLKTALVVFGCLTVLTGVIYPLLITAAALLFPNQARGSVIEQGGRQVGSSLVGQSFTDPKYFWPRPSATSPVPYAGDAGAGSNLSTTNPALLAVVKERIAVLRAADPENASPIPVELVTASASGLDPHLSPAAAEYQVARVARARGLDEQSVRQLVQAHTEGRLLGLLGQPRVNVLELNLALDAR